MGLFTLLSGNIQDSSLVLDYMKRFQNIINHPIVNDSKQVGLMRKYRREINHLMTVLSSIETDTIGAKLSQLQK